MEKHTLFSGSLTETNTVARICKDCVTNQFHKNLKCVVMVNSKWMVNCVGGGKKKKMMDAPTIQLRQIVLRYILSKTSGEAGPKINVMLRDNK